MYKKLLILKKSTNKFNFKKINNNKFINALKSLKYVKLLSKDKLELKMKTLK